MGLDNLTAVWNRVRDSLWFVPALLALGSLLLALITIQIDVAGILPTAPAGIWLFSGTASGARGVLTAIASGFITVTGVVFSITIVALQLASTQFTPRILRNFTADRVNQLVLGIFIGTFTYALLVLRVVRGEQGGVTPADLSNGSPAGPAGGRGGGAAGSGAEGAVAVEAFIPHLSVTVAVVLAVVSIGFLIYFIDHAARSVQASVIIDRVTSDALQTVERRLPSRVGEPGEEEVEAVVPRAQGLRVVSERSGYVQGIDEDRLMQILEAHRLTIRMEPEIGDYLLPGGVLATVWPAGSDSRSETAEQIRDAFVLGHERTPHLDLELGLIELSDIAIKALSPGINDPTTALICVDRLAEVLLAVALRDPPGRVRRAPSDGGTLILPRESFERFVDTAFDEIRHYGLENPRFTFSFLGRLADLGELLPHPHRPAIARHVAAILRAAPGAIEEPGDLRRVREAAEQTLHALDAVAPG